MRHIKQSFLQKKLIFQEEAIGFLFKRKFSDTSLKKQDQTMFPIPFMTIQKIEFFGSELKKRIKFTKISEIDSKQGSRPN